MTSAPELTVIQVSVSDPRVAPLLRELGDEYSSLPQALGSARAGGTHIGRDAHAEISRYPDEEFTAPHGGLLQLLLERGEPVAGGAFRRYDEATAELKRIWTHSAHSRRGLARRVVENARRRAVDTGASTSPPARVSPKPAACTWPPVTHLCSTPRPTRRPSARCRHPAHRRQRDHRPAQRHLGGLRHVHRRAVLPSAGDLRSQRPGDPAAAGRHRLVRRPHLAAVGRPVLRGAPLRPRRRPHPAPTPLQRARRFVTSLTKESA
jgi:GNAT superfamily N-acetyltransferase